MPELWACESRALKSSSVRSESLPRGAPREQTGRVAAPAAGNVNRLRRTRAEGAPTLTRAKLAHLSRAQLAPRRPTSPERSSHPEGPPLPSEARTPKAHLSRAKPAPGRSPLPLAPKARRLLSATSRLPQPTKVAQHRHVSFLQASCGWAAPMDEKSPEVLFEAFGCAGSFRGDSRGGPAKKSDPEMAKRPPFWGGLERWLRGEDLNLRPSGYEAKIVPSCFACQRAEMIHN